MLLNSYLIFKCRFFILKKITEIILNHRVLKNYNYNRKNKKKILKLKINKNKNFFLSLKIYQENFFILLAFLNCHYSCQSCALYQ
jgi:hypothetical protein